MLTFQGQSAALSFSTMLHLSEYIFWIYVVYCSVKGSQNLSTMKYYKELESNVISWNGSPDIYEDLIGTYKLRKLRI